MAEQVGKNTQIFPVGHAVYPSGCKRVVVMFDDGTEQVTETALSQPVAAQDMPGKVIGGVYYPPGLEPAE